MPITKPSALINVLVSFLIATSMTLVACGRGQDEEAASDTVFRHGFAESARPWINERFDADDQKLTFALFSDLTGGERERIFEIAIAQLALLRPELIVNVGDLIEGGTKDVKLLNKQWGEFDRRAKEATAPLFLTGGNHDLTNLAMREVWEERYGRRYYHFVYKRVLFMILDTEDYPPQKLENIYQAREEAMQLVATDGWGAFNETGYAKMPEQRTGEVGTEQADYFRTVIADNAEVHWTFILMHKPSWQKQGEQNFAAIESALSDRPYTVFSGHFHHYQYTRRYDRDYIQLATTGGVQFPHLDLSIDQLALVTVSSRGVDIANLKMSGIFDKTGHVPLGGDEFCFDARECSDD